jgi:hypothetical protein
MGKGMGWEEEGKGMGWDEEGKGKGWEEGEGVWREIWGWGGSRRGKRWGAR